MGRYTWTARTELEGQRYTATGDVTVTALVAEQFNTVADHGLWADIAQNTGGLLVPPTELDRMKKDLATRNELKARSYAHTSFSDLISLRWLFFIILGLLTIEWVLRRRSGAY